MKSRNRIKRGLLAWGLLLAGAATASAQQAPMPGDSSLITYGGGPSDEGSRSYVPSLFGAQPIAVDLWHPAVASTEPAPPVGVTDSSAENSGVIEPWAPYVRNPARQYLLYGLNVSGTYQNQSAPAGLPSDNTAFATLSPFLGFMGRTRTGYYVLQYAPTIVPYDPDTSDSLTYHNLSLNAIGNFTRRLSWNFNVGAGYGAELSRLSGNLTAQRVVSGVPIVDPSYASIQPLNGNSLNASAGFGLGYQLSTRQTIGISLSDAYSTFMFDASSAIPNFRSDTATVGLTFDRELNQRATLRAYASRSRVFAAVMPCSSVSGGVGVILRPTRTISVDLGGGPSSGCQAQSANFHATLSAALRGHFNVYAGGAREMNTAFRLNTRWEDNLVAGIGKQLGHAELGVDGGYFNGTSTLGLTGPTDGYFVSPRINYRLRLSRITGIGFSYRRFHGSTVPGGSPDVSFAMATITFSPHPVPLQK